MQIVYLKPFDPRRLTENGQKYCNYFSYARKEGDTITALHPWIKCRDYLLDVIMWEKDPSTYRGEVYGFEKLSGVNMNQTELLMRCEKGYLLDTIHIINELEKELGITPTSVEKVDDQIFYISGDGWWMSSTLHMSIYSLMLRVISWNKVTNLENMEAFYDSPFQILQGKTRKLLADLKKSNFKEACTYKNPKEYVKTTVHGGLGIYTFLCNMEVARSSVGRKRIDDTYTYRNLVDGYLDA